MFVFSALGWERRAGVEITVLAREVAAVGEIPGNDVGPYELFASAEGLRARFQFREVHLDSLHAEELTGRVEDLLVHFERPPLAGESLDAGPRHGADELGNVRESGFGGGSPPN